MLENIHEAAILLQRCSQWQRFMESWGSMKNTRGVQNVLSLAIFGYTFGL